MNQEVTFHGTSIRKDFRHYYRYHTQRTMYYLSLTVFLLVWILLSVIFMFYGLGLTYTPLEFVFAYSFSLFFPVVYALIWYANARLRSFQDDRENKDLAGDTHYEAGLGEIKLKTSNIQASYRWENFVSVHEHRDMFRLYVTKRRGFFIPKHYFDSPEQVGHFRQLLKQHAPTTKKHLF
ncbi:YcxB family protein [Marinococcus sp. PL1-022]|uniref:YcxB family protein n=1 Tax=Marinococcus sp. PL1-022 TaxID=3095363 RepID=UPI0029C49E8C|nr:YcxB family protein [Marinococcus sp. PL1-022]MDX6152676.1 YcxB family protein [Marinococcus sp. PL1-022]